MTWYAASIVTVIKVKQGIQDVFPVFEDVYLIEAIDRAAAHAKAEKLGLELQQLDDDPHYDGLPAKREFLGIRKIRSIYNPPDRALDSVPPVDGAEITHSFFEVTKEEDLKHFAEGRRVTVSYVDDD